MHDNSDRTLFRHHQTTNNAVACTVTYGRQLKWWSMIRYSWMGNGKVDAVMFVIEFHKFCFLLAWHRMILVAVQQQDWDFNAKTLNWLFYFTYFVFYWHRMIAVQQPDWDFHTKTTQGHKWWILSCRQCMNCVLNSGDTSSQKETEITLSHSSYDSITSP